MVVNKKTQRVSALDHKARDDTVEDRTVIKPFLNQGDKIAYRIGRNVRGKLRVAHAALFHFNRNDCIAHCLSFHFRLLSADIHLYGHTFSRSRQEMLP